MGQNAIRQSGTGWNQTTQRNIVQENMTEQRVINSQVDDDMVRMNKSPYAIQ